MTIHTLECRHANRDYLTAQRDGLSTSVIIAASFDDGEQGAVYAEVAEARAFARGILALADEIDGGEAVASDGGAPKVGDDVLITKEFPDGTGSYTGSTGQLLSVNPSDGRFPYEVDVQGYGPCAAHAVRKAPETPKSFATPRSIALLAEARAMLSSAAPMESVVHLARFLGGE